MLVLEKISSILPPPSFLRLPSAGVDVSDTSLKYIQFLPDHHSGKKLLLKTWGDIDIPEGALSRGEVIDKSKLTDVLREFKERTGTQYIRVSLPEERAYLFETEISRDISHQ